MITLFVVTDTYDPTIAGTLGDVEWINGENDATEAGKYTCVITTDNEQALVYRLDEDDNVCSYCVAFTDEIS